MHFTKKQIYPLLLIVLAALVALALRLYHIGDLQLQFDEWLGGWHANPELIWNGSLSDFVRLFWENVRHYVTSGQTIAWSSTVEAIKLFTGSNVVAIRLVAACGGAFGAAIVTIIAWKMFNRNPAALLAAAAVAVFSVPGIIFGQFADVYAAAVGVSALQLLVYYFWTRPRGDCRAWLVFAAAAFIAQLFMYTQLWLTAGIFLAGFWEFLLEKKPAAIIHSLIPAGLLYGALSGLHLAAMLQIIPWSESFRSYMASYYPMFWKGGQAGGTMWNIPGYFLWRIYDLFNYHFSLAFRPAIYQPLQWNWVSLPFLVVLVAGIAGRIQVGRTRLAIRLSAKQTGKGNNRLNYQSDGIVRLLLTTLISCLIANVLFLLPFGGCRQMLFILPLFALFYGWLVYMIIYTLRGYRKTGIQYVLSILLIALPIIPFGISFPAVYENRISRINLDLICDILNDKQDLPLFASEQNIHILEMALYADPRFENIFWPGYKYPCDALDADFITDFPTLSFIFKGRYRKIYWVRNGYFPSKIDEGIWIDMHISRRSRYEGSQMRKFYPTPEETIPAGYNLSTIEECPGNSPDALHQSIYWPPNSFYLYKIRQR